MDTFSDKVYVDAFQATGCPNNEPDITWWKTQSMEEVFKDMFSYCELTREGKANERQKNKCCGNINCKVTSCVKQLNKITGINNTSILMNCICI